MSDTFTICFRIPTALRAPLTKLAAANRRSINAEVVMAIEDRVAALTSGKPDSRGPLVVSDVYYTAEGKIPAFERKAPPVDRADINTTIKRLRKERRGRSTIVKEPK